MTPFFSTEFIHLKAGTDSEPLSVNLITNRINF